MHAATDPAGGAAGANLQRGATVAEQRHAVKDFFPISSRAPAPQKLWRAGGGGDFYIKKFLTLVRLDS